MSKAWFYLNLLANGDPIKGPAFVKTHLLISNSKSYILYDKISLFNEIWFGSIPQGVTDNHVNIGLGTGLVLIKQQAFTSGDLWWPIYMYMISCGVIWPQWVNVVAFLYF